MPRNSLGIYSLPAGTIVSTGDVIQTSQHNPAMNDIASALSNSLDRDGTGGMRAALQMGGNRVQNVGTGVDLTDAVNVGQLQQAGSYLTPGIILDFAGATPPTGWLLCGGQSVSRTTYADLFAVIGTTYGSDSGTTFKIPDLRGRVVAGCDFSVSGSTADRLTNASIAPSAGIVGGAGGTQTVTLTSDQMPSHTHTATVSTDGAHSHQAMTGNSDLAGNGIAKAFVQDIIGNTSVNGAHTHTVTNSSTGGGGAHLNVQPTFMLNKIIKI